MPYTFDPDTHEIKLPVGDTVNIPVRVRGDAIFHAMVFAIYDRADGTDLLRVPVEIVDGAARIRLATKHTRDLEPGKYKWNLRLVTDPEYDENGNIMLQDINDDAMTVFGPENSEIPDIILVRNGGRV